MNDTKKLALLHILEIYQKYSDCDHPLKQENIISHLSCDYGIEMERKAIGRNVSLLKEAGIEIESNRKGSWLDSRSFENAELKLLIDGVLTSKHITAKHSKQLIDKLCSQSNIYFRSHVKNIYSVNEWSKTDNCTLFYNIDIVDEAIENNKQIKFYYNKYGIDKTLHRTSKNIVSPYQLLLNNQRYYLMAFNEKWKEMTFYRMDRITDIEILDVSVTDIRKIEGYKNGIDYRELSSSLPYMYSDKKEVVEFLVEENIIDLVIDWFGFDTRINMTQDGKIKVTVRVSQNAMEYWAMQFLNYVEILSPQSLREKIKQNLSVAVERYNKSE